MQNCRKNLNNTRMLSPSAYEITFQAKFNASSDEHVNTGAYTNSKEEKKRTARKKKKHVPRSTTGPVHSVVVSVCIFLDTVTLAARSLKERNIRYQF